MIFLCIGEDIFFFMFLIKKFFWPLDLFYSPAWHSSLLLLFIHLTCFTSALPLAFPISLSTIFTLRVINVQNILCFNSGILCCLVIIANVLVGFVFLNYFLFKRFILFLIPCMCACEYLLVIAGTLGIQVPCRIPWSQSYREMWAMGQGTENQTQVFCKSSMYLFLTTKLSLQPSFPFEAFQYLTFWFNTIIRKKWVFVVNQ